MGKLLIFGLIVVCLFALLSTILTGDPTSGMNESTIDCLVRVGELAKCLH